MNIHLSVHIGTASTDAEIWSREICRLERTNLIDSNSLLTVNGMTVDETKAEESA